MKYYFIQFRICWHSSQFVRPLALLLAAWMLASAQAVCADQLNDKNIKQALLIGVNQENELLGLPFVPAIDRDLARMKDLLQGQGYQVVILLNPDRQTAVGKFEEMAVMSVVNEFLFYYSGHSADSGDKGFLVPVLSEQASNAAKEAAENGQSPFAEKHLADELISSEELHNLLRLSLADKQVVIVDGNTRLVCKPQLFAENIQSLHYFCAGPGAVAKPDGGVFTSMIVKGLRGKADKDSDGRVDALELETWLKRRIPEVLGEKSTLMRNPAYYHFGENQVLSDLLMRSAQ
jgi:hypothetical protein